MKYKQPITVFIPAYNEEENLEETSKEILLFLEENFEKYEFIIVANISKDKTTEIAKNIAKKNKHVRVVQQKDFVGYGLQLKAGWESARNDLVFYTDSDRQFDIEELKHLMRYIDKYDIVFGYRKNRKDPAMRLFYSRLYNYGVRFLLGLKLRDMECAFKLCKKKVIDAIKPITKDRGADVEFLLKSHLKGFTIKQLPVTHRPRIAGVSEAESGGKIFVRVKMSIIIALIKEALELRRMRFKYGK